MLPHRVHEALRGILHVVGHHGQHLAIGVVTPCNASRPQRTHSNLATACAISSEKEHPILQPQVLWGDLSKIRVIHCRPQAPFITGPERNHHSRAGGGIVHAEHPDGEQPCLRRPGLLPDIGDCVIGFIANHLHRRWHPRWQEPRDIGHAEQPHLPTNPNIKPSTTVIEKTARVLKRNRFI